MFEAKLEAAATLKKIVDAIRDMLGECNFECNETGIVLQSLDKSHIVLVSLLLGSDGFSEYRCDRTVTLGLNVNSLATVLKCGDVDNILTLEAEDSGNADELKITFEDTKRDRISEYSIKLMDIDQDYLNIPETEYTASITMPSDDLQRILRDFKSFSDSVTIEADKESVRFIADGDTKGKVTIKPHHDVENSDRSVEISISEPVKLSFNLTYFTNIAKSASMASTVKLLLSADTPAEISYPLSTGHLKYFFAPKIGEDE